MLRRARACLMASTGEWPDPRTQGCRSPPPTSKPCAPTTGLFSALRGVRAKARPTRCLRRPRQRRSQLLLHQPDESCRLHHLPWSDPETHFITCSAAISPYRWPCRVACSAQCAWRFTAAAAQPQECTVLTAVPCPHSGWCGEHHRLPLQHLAGWLRKWQLPPQQSTRQQCHTPSWPQLKRSSWPGQTRPKPPRRTLPPPHSSRPQQQHFECCGRRRRTTDCCRTRQLRSGPNWRSQ